MEGMEFEDDRSKGLIRGGGVLSRVAAQGLQKLLLLHLTKLYPVTLD
jgi:hypothetical protein